MTKRDFEIKKRVEKGTEIVEVVRKNNKKSD